jgi:hypothetical protein
MSLVTSLSWIGKGFAKADPVRITTLPEEYKREMAEAAEEEGVPSDHMEIEDEDDSSELPRFGEIPEEDRDLSDSEEEEEQKIVATDALIAVGVQN